MKSFNFLLAAGCALLAAVSCGIRLWFAYELLALPCFAAVILALPFASFLHELGHMLFGAAVKIKSKPKLSLFGSSRCMLIPKTDKNLRGRLIFTALGGIIVNALFIVLGFVTIFVSVLPAWLCVFMPASVFLFLMNTVPAQLQSGKTDGQVLSGLISLSDEAVVMLAVMTVQARVLNGAKIEEVDEGLLFDLPVIREDDESFIALTGLRYEYCKAKGDEQGEKLYAARLKELQIYT